MSKLVDASAGRVIINELFSKGYTLAFIAEKSGISKATIHYIRNKPGHKIHVRTLRDILELPDKLKGVEPRPRGNIGATRRVRALRSGGYKAAYLIEYTGLSEDTLSRAARGGIMLNSLTVETIAYTYEKLKDYPKWSVLDEGAAKRCRNRGWIPPEGWRERDIDNPSERPWPPYKEN